MNCSPGINKLLLLLITCFALTSLCFPASSSAETAKAVGPTVSKQLEGRWMRPDGGYILELKEIKKDGTLTATYFNPKPIKVGRAELRSKDGTTAIFVELSDVNYPGSQYRLIYDRKADKLLGTYYQAVAKETYEVEFVRAR